MDLIKFKSIHCNILQYNTVWYYYATRISQGKQDGRILSQKIEEGIQNTLWQRETNGMVYKSKPNAQEKWIVISNACTTLVRRIYQLRSWYWKNFGGETSWKVTTSKIKKEMGQGQNWLRIISNTGLWY